MLIIREQQELSFNNNSYTSERDFCTLRTILPVCFKIMSRLYCAVLINKISLDGIRISVIHYEPHTLSLRPFIFFFQKLHWFLQSVQSCFIKWYEKERSIKLPLEFTSCYMKQNKKKRKQTLESGQYRVKIIFKALDLKSACYTCIVYFTFSY